MRVAVLRDIPAIVSVPRERNNNCPVGVFVLLVDLLVIAISYISKRYLYFSVGRDDCPWSVLWNSQRIIFTVHQACGASDAGCVGLFSKRWLCQRVRKPASPAERWIKACVVRW